jgi:hypothetical protein
MIHRPGSGNTATSIPAVGATGLVDSFELNPYAVGTGIGYACLPGVRGDFSNGFLVASQKVLRTSSPYNELSGDPEVVEKTGWKFVPIESGLQFIPGLFGAGLTKMGHFSLFSGPSLFILPGF